MDNGLNPGNRPRRGVAFALAALGLFAVVAAAAVVATPKEAEAAGLEAFSSCGELSGWGVAAEERMIGGSSFGSASSAADGAAPIATNAEVARETGAAGGDAGSAPTSAVAEKASLADQQAVDATNVVVEGVDELDLVDRLGEDRALVVAGPTLAIVDLAEPRVLATHPVPYGAQVSYDRESGRVWVVGGSTDGSRVEVTRLAVGTDSLDPVGTWSTPGQLVDARRIGGQLHLVASDGFFGVDGPRVPFGGDPVPCTEVLHPVGPSEPTASLIVTLPVSGEMEPLRAAEVVGSGQLVHVTDGAAYLATPQWGDDGRSTTAIHRFDLGTLDHTGSGSVTGTLLNDFSMSEDGGYLRVAITAQGNVGFAGSGGVIVDDMARDVVIEEGPLVEPAPREAELQAPVTSAEEVPDTTAPDPSPETTVPEPTTTVVGPTSTTSTSTSTTTSTSTSTTSTSTTSTTTSTTAPPVGATIPGPGPGDPFNRVVILDTEGSLDVVGATPWFGHPGETLHGIRFDGSTAYAVTFLQTDPFYVLDLSDPASPKVAGEVELPGFSAYLHPVGNGRVVGFGPGASGRQEAKLFDVSDPAAPEVVDQLVLGDQTPVVDDHHAFVSLGDGRFAVPVTSWDQVMTECVVPEDIGPAEDVACAPDRRGVLSQVVELEVRGDQLREVDRASVRLQEQVSRVLPVGDGWAVLAGSSLGTIDGSGQQGATVTI